MRHVRLGRTGLYPIGGDLDTVGRTEEILGRWLRDAVRPS